jgi:hypothetical protein
MNKIICILILFIGLHSNAQRFPFYKYHDWENNPVQTDEKQKDELYYYTKYLLSVEYVYHEQAGQYYKYKTEHYKVKLNSDAGIEDFNKIYIPMEDVLRVKKLSTRVIKKDEVITFKPKVEEFYSEDEEERYYYFPVSGLELGDEIEIMYTLQMHPEFDGDQIYFQGDIPVFDFDFYFIGPNDAYFQFLAHNGLKQPQLIDTIVQRNQWVLHMDSIPAYEPEYFSEYNNTSMKMDIALRGFDNPSDKSYSPYEEFNVTLNAAYNKNNEGKDAKALTMLNEEIGVNEVSSKEDKIRLIENFIKTEMLISVSFPEQSMADIVKSRKCNSIGTILLFMGLCDDADILYQYGFVTDRYDTFLNAEIESMYFMQNYFLYFPELDNYLAPLDFATRYGYLDANWVPNNGYFLTQEFDMQGGKTTGEVKELKGTTAYDNQDSIIIRININESMDDGEIEIERHIKGYKAGKYQTYYYLYTDMKKKKQHDELLNFFNDNSKFRMTEINNVSPDDAFAKPLIIKGKVTELHNPFLEKAGEKTIFKLGKLFGEHTSVADLEKKETDFVFANPMIRSYSVIVTFPEGVEVSNNDAVFQTKDFCPLEDILMASELKIDGNVIRYNTREEYLSHRYSIEDKEDVIKAFMFYDELTKMNLIIE